MATAVFGKIDEYDSEKEDWPNYVERLTHFLKANSITTNEQKQSVFLSVIGPTTYKLLRSLVAPDKPGDKSFKDLVKKLTDHFNPTPSEIVQRFKFHGRYRQQGESVAAYVAELRSLAEYCNFGGTLDDMLRDQLVWGVKNDAIQQKLLGEAKLTFKRAMELAQGLETAAQNVQTLKASTQGSDPGKSEVHKITNAGKGLTCHRCGKIGHIATKCRYKDTVCHKCGKKGHLKAVCRSKPKGGGQRKRNPHTVKHVQEDDDSEDESPLYHIGSREDARPIKLMVQIEGHQVEMELDTGAAVSLMSEKTFKELWPEKKLSPTKCRLVSYSKEPIPVAGSVDVSVEYQHQQARLSLIVVAGSGPSLFGRNWLQHLVLDWKEIHQIRRSSLQALLDKYSSVFQEGLGTFQGLEAKIVVDPQATPRFCKARSVPYAMTVKVEEELQRLTQEGILEPVEFASWAAPIVAVLKADKSSVRICGDFKRTVNPVSKLDKYPIPKVEDLFAKLAGGELFTKLDLSQAYLQLPLDSESKQFVVINTHKGLFQYTRLPYGISSAPGIFQRVMETLLQGIPGVVVYIDDILITGATEEKHLKSLEEVLRRLDQAGLRAKKKKCQFMVPSVGYLGYRIDREGIHPLPEKVKAIKEAPNPTCVKELKAYLGLLTYYSKFLPNLSSTLSPLYRLLQKEQPWRWEEQEEEAFVASKELLTSSSLLVHFNPELKLVLACDASAYGIGAVLSHRMEDGSDKPIGYVSRTLSKAERNYSQLEKEGLACVFGVKKFHSYLFGHSFELVTDHKPLLSLLSEHKSTSPQASARVKRWSLILAAYEYTMVFRKTEEHSNADALSRLPLPIVPKETETPPELVLLTESLEDAPVTVTQISSLTRRDPCLSRVVECLRKGWPGKSDSTIAPYFSRKSELSLLQGCVLWGSRVIVPSAVRKVVLQELHGGHPGMSRMKSLARMFVWWPGLDSDIEQLVRECTHCQSTQPSPPPAPLHPWKWPTRPWSRLHLDFAGPLHGKMFLVLIDSHSKWIETFCTSTASSAAVIEELRTVFAQFGLPDTIVTDNGSCFVSEEFKAFLRKNGVQHITSAPYHPATNGLAERAVQIVKKGLKKVTEGTIRSRLAQILFSYRITPQSTTNVSPSELLLGRRARSRLDLLKPDIAGRVEHKQQQQKLTHDRSAKERQFKIGESVFVKNRSSDPVWLSGKVQEVTGPLSYRVQLEDGRLWRCHQDQLRKRSIEQEPEVVQLPDLSPIQEPEPEPEFEEPESEESSRATNAEGTQRAYPRRAHVQPDRYEPGL